MEVLVECLETVLFQSAAIMDTSSLSLLQDTFPVEIFNFQVFLGVLECGNYDLAFYSFPIICWNEAANNSLAGKKLRLFLLECALYMASESFIKNNLKQKRKWKLSHKLLSKELFRLLL